MDQIKIDENYMGKEHAGLFFVTSAMVKKPTKYHQEVMVIKDGLAYATDGRRLHFFKTQLKLNGHFRVVKRTKSIIELFEVEQGQYPDVMAIYNKEYEGAKQLDLDFEGNFFGAVASVIRNQPDGECLNYDFLKDIPSGIWQVTIGNDGRPIKLECGDMTAFVMPMLM